MGKINEKKSVTLHEKLIELQQTLKVPKNHWNDFSKFYYRNCEDILENVKPLLGNKFFVNLTDKIIQKGDRFYVQATATISDGKEELSSEAYAREPISKKGMDESQITGTASSYARKYALNGLFAIDDADDADSADNRQKEAPQPPRQQTSVATRPATNQQQALMKQFKMDTKQKPPKCSNCNIPMTLVKRKDGSNVFWSCPNWRNNGCKVTFNVDDVDIDGFVTKQNSK